MNFKNVILSIFLYMFFSLSSVFMKLASLEDLLIYKFVFFCLSIFILGLFSLAWQILLKKHDLSKVYIFKSTTIIWGMIYGFVVFEEKITIYMILGSLITIIGVLLILEDKKNE